MPEILSTPTYGRVYTRSSPSEEYTLLDSAYFSKLDLRIYTKDKTRIHPEFFKLRGKKFKLSLELRNPDFLNNRTEKASQVMIHLPIKLGENQMPDIEYMEAALEEELRICRSTKLLPMDRLEELLQNLQGSALWLFCTPGRSILKQSFLLKLCPVLMFDDMIEELTNSLTTGDGENGLFSRIPFRIMSRLSNEVIGPMLNERGTSWRQSVDVTKALGNIYMEADIPQENYIEVLTFGKSMLSYFHTLKDAAVETSKVHGISCEGYLKSVHTSFESAGIEFCNEYGATDKIKMFPTTLKLRQFFVGGQQITEAVALQHGIQLSSRVRKSVVFNILMEMVSKIFQKFNDLLSFAKEAKDHEEQLGMQSNELFLRHVRLKWPLEEAIYKMVEEMNESMLQFEEVAKLLIAIIPEGGNDEEEEEREEVQRYAEMLKEVIVGFIQWTAYAKRYEQKGTFDCYIENY